MMNSRKSPFLAAVLLLMVVGSVVHAKPHEDLVGKTFYTSVNIWYERHTIPSINYHVGRMLPFGTRIVQAEILDVKAEIAERVVSILDKEPGPQDGSTDKIRIKTESGEEFVIQFIKKFASSRMTVRDYFNQYFVTEDPASPDGPFRKLSEAEQKNVKAGKVEVGMSKAAVLMARGYPPSRKTPSLSDDKWIYWESRRKHLKLMFMDGKLEKIM